MVASKDSVEYWDTKLKEVEYHRYKIRAQNGYGWGSWSTIWEVYLEGYEPDFLQEETVGIYAIEPPPSELTLNQNYPNPFNPTTTVRFGLPKSSRVNLRILNIRGQVVRTLVDDEKPAGWYTVTWDGKNESGQYVASGIYLYLIETDEGKILKKMTLIR